MRNEIRSLNINPAQAANANFSKGEGCASCNATGYCGRHGDLRDFVITDEIQR